MAAQTESNIVATELERVVPKLPSMFERDEVFFSNLEKKNVEIVSNRQMRVPLELRPGGSFGHFSADGGDLGRGSGPITDKAVIQPAFLKIGIEFTTLTEWATDDKRKAIINNTRRNIAVAMQEFRRGCDSLSMTAGNGVLGTVTSVTFSGGNAIAVMTTDGFGVRLLRYNQPIQIYLSSLAALRDSQLGDGAATPCVINFLDLANKTIKYPDPNSATTAGDVVVVSGVSGASPSSIKGIPYHDNNSTAGTWLGFTRSSTPEIVASGVTANSKALVLPLPRLAINKIGDRVGMEYLKKCTAWMHPAQEQAYEELGFLVTRIDKSAKSESLDMYFGGAKQMAGAPVKTSFSWDRTRIDFIDLNVWGRAVMKEIGFYEREGQRIFEIRGQSGGVATSNIFYIVTAFDIFVSNPASCSYIYSLAVPSGY